MNSPFIFQNILVLLLLGAVFAGSLYLLLSKKVSRFICDRSKILIILYRAATTVFFSFSMIVLAGGIWLFHSIEIDDISRACWTRTYAWSSIVPGMPRARAAEILGAPFRTIGFENGEQAVYCLSPVSSLDSGIVIFSRNADETELKVISKTPDDQAVSGNLHKWIPDDKSQGYSNVTGIISESFSFCAWYGLFGLAIFSLYPFKMRELSALRMIYTPLAALLFKAIYDNHQVAGWDFELFSVSPLLTVIFIGWTVRVMVILFPD